MEEVTAAFTLETEEDAKTAGSILAIECLLAEIISRMPNSEDIIGNVLPIGDGIELEDGADRHLIGMMGASARETVAAIGGMVSAIRKRRPNS